MKTRHEMYPPPPNTFNSKDELKQNAKTVSWRIHPLWVSLNWVGFLEQAQPSLAYFLWCCLDTKYCQTGKWWLGLQHGGGLFSQSYQESVSFKGDNTKSWALSSLITKAVSMLRCYSVTGRGGCPAFSQKNNSFHGLHPVLEQRNPAQNKT